MALSFALPSVPLERRYAVMQRINDAPKQVGIITAINFNHASTKALQIFNRHVWVERLS